MKKTGIVLFIAGFYAVMGCWNLPAAEAVKMLPAGGGTQVTCLDYGIEMRGEKTVKSCLLAVPGDFSAPGGALIACEAKYAIAFGSDGKVAYCTLNKDMAFRRTPSATVSCKAGGRLVIRPDGTVEIATLKDSQQLPYSKKASVACRASSQASFRTDGYISACILDQESLFVGAEQKATDKTCQSGGLIAFDDDGLFGGCYPPPPAKQAALKGAAMQGGQSN